MAYVISDACVMCGACADACPLGIISEGDGKYVIDADQCVDDVLAVALGNDAERAGKYVIDADQCVECGTCAAECPNEAITQE